MTLKKAYVYSTLSLDFEREINTADNPHGLAAANLDKNMVVAAVPSSKKTGQISVTFFNEKEKTLEIQAHKSIPGMFVFNIEGSLLASVSDKGKLIRVFSMKDGSAIREFRRGTAKASIYSICFDASSSFIACSGSSGTLHVFSMTMESKSNAKSS